MSIELTTPGTTGEARRSSSTIDYNSNYTILFRVYIPSSGSGFFLWGLGGSTSGSGGSNLGSRQDTIRGSGGGNWKLTVNNGSGNSDAISSTAVYSGSAAWHSVSVRRTSSTSLILRVNGSDIATSTVDMSAREAVQGEFFFRDDNNGANAMSGCRITNYKSWNTDLTTTQIDAEFAATAFTVTTNKYSGSPMGDESTLSGNDTADGSGATWTLDAGLSAGTNDPSVTYGSAFLPRGMLLGVG